MESDPASVRPKLNLIPPHSNRTSGVPKIGNHRCDCRKSLDLNRENNGFRHGSPGDYVTIARALCPVLPSPRPQFMILRRPRSSSDLSEFYCPTRRQGIEEVPEPELRVLVRDPIFYKDSGDCYNISDVQGPARPESPGSGSAWAGSGFRFSRPEPEPWVRGLKP
jgi:hypothetical protein